MNARKQKPRVTWLGRFWRGRRPDRNPLRRASDRAETTLLALLAAAFLAGAPFGAMATGAWAHTVAGREQAAQQAARHLVPAVVLRAPPASADDRTAQSPQAKARWTAPDGARVTSEIPAPYGTRAGETVRIWVTSDGALTQPPLLDSQVSGLAQLAEIGAVAALAATLTTTGMVARRSLDRHRIAAWDAEWRAVGPRWTTRT